MLRDTIVTDGVRVPADTSWHGVILRRADGTLGPGEKQIGDLAVSEISCCDVLARMIDRRTADGTDVRDRINRYLDDAGLSDQTARVVPLTGDASDRRYFRVLLRDEPSQVMAVQPGPIEFDTLPFVNVARLLTAMPVPIPRILGHSNELGVIALQDLGDVTLQAHLGAASPGEHDALYREAVSLIDALQRRGAELTSNDYIPYRVAFDVEKLTWELQFFLKHFLEGYRGVSLSGPARAALTEEFAVIAEELAAEPRVLCHRDYHSRNLMLHDGRLYIIDFQDARMGPDTYDLVSLLRDSYVDFTEPQVDQLIALFVGAARAVDDRPADDFRRRFDLMSVQRNLKALGTFGFQTISRANTVYIQYMPRTLRYVRANLDRYPRFARLRADPRRAPRGVAIGREPPDASACPRTCSTTVDSPATIWSTSPRTTSRRSSCSRRDHTSITAIRAAWRSCANGWPTRVSSCTRSMRR